MGQVVELGVFREKKKAEQDEKFLSSRMPDPLREAVEAIRQIAATSPTGSPVCFLSEALAGAWEDWYRVLPDVTEDVFRAHTQLVFQPMVSNDAEMYVKYDFSYGDSPDQDEADGGVSYEACKIAVRLEKKVELDEDFKNEYREGVCQMNLMAERTDKALEGEHAGAGAMTFPIFRVIDLFERKGIYYAVQRTWKDRIHMQMRHHVDEEHVMTMVIDLHAAALKNAYGTLKELYAQ